MFEVIDMHTGARASRHRYQTRLAAQRRADKLDLQYGAIRYAVRLIAATS